MILFDTLRPGRERRAHDHERVHRHQIERRALARDERPRPRARRASSTGSTGLRRRVDFSFQSASVSTRRGVGLVGDRRHRGREHDARHFRRLRRTPRRTAERAVDRRIDEVALRVVHLNRRTGWRCGTPWRSPAPRASNEAGAAGRPPRARAVPRRPAAPADVRDGDAAHRPADVSVAALEQLAHEPRGHEPRGAGHADARVRRQWRHLEIHAIAVRPRRRDHQHLDVGRRPVEELVRRAGRHLHALPRRERRRRVPSISSVASPART